MNTTTPQTQPTTNTDSNSKPPLRDFALAEQAPPDHWIYTQGAQFGFAGALPKSIADSQTKASGIPRQRARKYTPEQLRQKLLELGGRDATFDQTAPRAFELPASGVSGPKPDTETRLNDSLEPILDQLEKPNDALIQKQGRLLEKLFELSKKDPPKD